MLPDSTNQFVSRCHAARAELLLLTPKLLLHVSSLEGQAIAS